MSVEAERIVADARRYAEVQAKYTKDAHADLVREVCIAAYLQGFKIGLKHAVAEATGKPS